MIVRRDHMHYCLFLVLLLLLAQTPALAANLQDYVLAQENEYLRLFVNEETAALAVMDKETGEVWFSGLQDVRTETIKRGGARDAMRGVLTLNYFTPLREGRSLNSYVDSVQNEEFSVSISEDKVRFDFILGKQWGDSAHYPVVISQEKFEEALEKVEDRFDKQVLQEAYTLMKLEPRTTDPYTRVFVFGVEPKTLFGNDELVVLQGKLLDQYLGTNNLPEERTKHYIERLTDTIIENRADYDRRAQIVPADVEFLRNGAFYVLLKETFPSYYRPEIFRIFSDIGYGPQDVIDDHAQTSIDQPRPNPQVFKVAFEAKLDGKNLVVTVPTGEIEYPINVLTADQELATYLPYSLDLMPLFGAAGRDSEGYLLVPDRSGGLIYLNNSKKLDLPSYYSSVYGTDRAIAPQYERISEGSLIRMPVYGLKEEGRAWFAIIEDGQALANISAEVAGKTDSYNKIFARFLLTPRTTITLYGVDSTRDDRLVDAYAVKPYTGDITVRYTFLTGEQANYGEMAKHYRSYLVENYGLEKIAANSEVPLNIELLGGFHDQEALLGAPREIVRPLTTYENALEIIEDLLQRDVPRLRVRYTGWSRGGIKHSFPTKVELERSLGNKGSFERLFSAGPNVEIFLDVDFMTVYRNTMADGFKVGSDAARFLTRDAAKIYDFDIATFQRDSSRFAYILSARQLDRVVGSFVKSLNSFPDANLSLRNMAKAVYADFQDKADKALDRQQSLRITETQMGAIQASNEQLMVAGGNSSAFPYATQIVEAPTDSSVMLIIDEAIPFYQMVLHGYIDYSGAPRNRAGITQTDLLRTLETGELPYFQWSYADSSIVKETEFDYLLATNYSDSIDEALALYFQAYPVLSAIRGQTIVSHKKLEPSVYRTVYENGVEVVVNYSADVVVVDGDVVEPLSYVVHERSGM